MGIAGILPESGMWIWPIFINCKLMLCWVSILVDTGFLH